MSASNRASASNRTAAGNRVASSTDLLRIIQNLGVRTDDRLHLEQDAPDEIIRKLVQSRALTTYQAEQLLQGNADSLVLGQYLLLEPLGRGGMGEVFKAQHRLMKRIVALKVIRAERLAHPDASQRFLREIRALGQMSHPHLVIAHDAEEIDGRCFLVMEYCEGETLRQRVRDRGALPVALACSYMRQVALGLEHAHARGIIHRDIKPENMLITAAGVKVLDLGLATWPVDLSGDTAFSSLTQHGQLLGTPDYISPEQVTNARSADPRSDIYSLGCTFYFALTGQPPFPGGTALEKALRHRTEEPMPVEQLCTVPLELARFVRGMMHKNPNQRVQSAREVVEKLATWAASSQEANATTISAAGTRAGSKPSSQAPQPPAGSRSRLRWGAAIAIGGLLGIGLLVWLIVTLLGGNRFPEKDSLDGKVAGAGEKGRADLYDKTGSPIDSRPIVVKGGENVTTDWELVASRGFPETLWAAAFAPDGREVLVAHGEWVGAAGPRYVSSWNLKANSVRQIANQELPIRRIVFSPENGLLAVASGSLNWESPGEVAIWKPGSGKTGPLVRFVAHKQGCGGIAFSRDDLVLATCGRDGDKTYSLRLWEASSGRQLSLLQHSPHVLNGVAISPDGAWLACGGSERHIQVWSLRTEKKILESAPLSGTVISLAFAPDSQSIVAALLTAEKGDGTGSVAYWEFEARRPVTEIRLPGTSGSPHVLDVAFHPDGTTVAAARDDREIWLCDVKTLVAQRLANSGHRHGVSSVAFASDGRLVSTCSELVRVWQKKDKTSR